MVLKIRIYDYFQQEELPHSGKRATVLIVLRVTPTSSASRSWVRSFFARWTLMVFFSSFERPIDFFAVADSDNENHELFLFFFEYDSVVPDS